MPGLGSPFVREMRRIAAAHAAFPGSPPRDPAELLAWYDERGATAAEDDSIMSISRRDFLRRSAVVGAGVAGATMLGWGARDPRTPLTPTSSSWARASVASRAHTA